MKKLGEIILLWLALGFIYFALIEPAIPDTYVYWSTSRDECVKVVIGDQERDCSMYPDLDKYERIWVE